MKRFFILFSASLIFTCWAVAETVYARANDIYYHAIPDCMGREYAETDDASGLYPCPICVQDKNEYPGLEVFRIAGLTIIRMPDDWMAVQADTMGIFAYTEEIEYTGEEAESHVAEYLHGDAYTEFKRIVREGGTAKDTARFMSNLVYGFDRCHTVHIGGAWYDVYGNLEYPVSYDCDLTFRFFLGPMSMTDGTLKEHISDEYDDFFAKDFRNPPLTVLNDTPIWSAEIDGGKVEIYKTHGFYLLTLRLTGQDALLMPKVTVNGLGWPEPVEMLAADVNRDALYGAVLSQGQAETLMRGDGSLHWTRFSQFSFDSNDDPYSLFKTEKEYGDYIVVDSEGKEILHSDEITQYDSVFLADDYMPRSAFEAVGLVDEDGWYDEYDFCSCVLYDAAHDEVLLKGDYLYYFDVYKTHFYRGLDYEVSFDTAVYVEGEQEPIIRVFLREGARNPVTSFTVSRNAVIYMGYYADGLPIVPDDCFAFRFYGRNQNEKDDLCCIVIVWNVEEGELPSVEELGFDESRFDRVR
ncbi:MAG: hypothetical protein K5663_08350 [Clostridiales bacterium]|nr:hypothetical protein [Clostridiales bacterium]